MAGAVGDATGLRPVFNAGHEDGRHAQHGHHEPIGQPGSSGAAWAAIGNAFMGY
jgi:hypothetical protein